MPIPFERKTLLLKQVPIDELNEMQKNSVHFFFPGYHDGAGFSIAKQPAGSTVSSPTKVAQESGFVVIEDHNQHRRFAGDFSLSRGRYHTVCRDERGDDGGLLLRELDAYSKPEIAGLFSIYDTTNSDSAMDPLPAPLNPKMSALVCIPRELRRFPSRFREAFPSAVVNTAVRFVAVVPLRVSAITFKKLIDLRMPKTRQWLVTELTRLKNRTTGEVVFPLAGTLDDFYDVLPTLLSPDLGDGHGATQVAGSWLRRLGAEALVFPSARADARVSIASGELREWYGWNLVDYRDSPTPAMNDFVILSRWHRFPSTAEGSDRELPFEFQDAQLVAERSGPASGSFALKGIEAVQRIFSDISLWKAYAERMGSGLGEALLRFSFSLASDEGRNVDSRRLAQVSRIFMLALVGGESAKQDLRRLPAMPWVLSICPDCNALIERFLSLCD